MDSFIHHLKIFFSNRSGRNVVVAFLVLIIFCVFVRSFAIRPLFQMATGFELHYGKLNIDLLPTLSVSVNDLEFRDPEVQSDQPLLSAASIHIDVSKVKENWTLSSVQASTLLVDLDKIYRLTEGDEEGSGPVSEPSELGVVTFPDIGPISLRDVTLLLPPDESGQVVQSSLAEFDVVPSADGYQISVAGAYDSFPLAVELVLAQHGSTIEVELESLTVAGSRFAGELSADLGVAPPLLEFDLRGDSFEWTSAVESVEDWDPNSQLGSNQLLSLDWMREWEVVGQAAISKLVYDDLTLSNVTFSTSLKDGVLFIGPLRSELIGGEAVAALKIDFSSGSRARWNFGLRAQDLYLSKWPTLGEIGVNSVAPTEVLIDLDGFGRSTGEMLATTNGKLQIMVGESELDGQALDALGGDLVLLLHRFVRAGEEQESESTEILCGSVNLVFEDGLVNADRKIVFQSPHVDLFFNSVIDLHREKLEFNILPRARGGVGVNLNKYFKSIKLTGNLTGLRPSIDAVGSAALAAELWASTLTGGGSSVVLGVLNAFRHRGKTCEGILPRLAEPGVWFPKP